MIAKVRPMQLLILKEKGITIMSYCFMSIEKIKTGGALMSKYHHNYRLVEVENADASLRHLNEELIKLPVKNGLQMDPQEVFRERIQSLPYYQTHNIRKNAVHALEIVTTFSKDDFVDIEKWKQKNVEWMKDTFNVAGDGKDNVISMVYHGDECGNVHCHALVIPIDENGHLNARRFLNGSRAMSEHQTTYAKYMQSFGLKRGLKGSQAKHEDIKRFYAELNQAMNRVPERLPEESVEKYMERAIDQLKTAHAASLRKIKETERKQLRHVNIRYKECRDAIDREFKGRQKLKEEIKELTEKKESLQEETEDLSINLRLMQESLAEKEEKAKKYDKFMEGLETFEKEHPEQAAAFREEVKYILDYSGPEQDLSMDDPSR